jgi:hypothetical protein
MEEQERWERWIHRRVFSPEEDHPPSTGLEPLTLLSFVLPTVMPSLGSWALDYTTKAASQAVMSSALSLAVQNRDLVSSMLSVPLRLFFSPAPISPPAQSILAKASAATAVLPRTSTALVLGVVGVSTLFFEYVGMHAMVHETQRSRVVQTGGLKNALQTRYRQEPFYAQNNQPMWTGQVDAVRVVYNILVGVNSSLFYVAGGKSIDPTAEIMHWSQILLYWEILARLVHLYGWSPVGAASRLLFSRLLARRR